MELKLKVEKNLSDEVGSRKKNTAKHIRSAVFGYFEHINQKEIGSMEEIDSILKAYCDNLKVSGDGEKFKGDLINYVRMRKNKNCSAATINQNLTDILEIMKKNDLTLPPAVIEEIRKREIGKSQTLTQYENFTREEIKKIIDYAPVHIKAILLTTVNTGARINEVLESDLNDYSPDEGILEINKTKGGLIRRVILTDEGKRALSLWVDNQRDQFILSRSNQHSFSDRHRLFPVVYSSYLRTFNKVLRSVGLEKIDPTTHRRVKSTHTTRKYYRTNMVNSTNQHARDIVNSQIGHYGLESTYALNNRDEIRQYVKDHQHLIEIMTPVVVDDPQTNKAISILAEQLRREKEEREKDKIEMMEIIRSFKLEKMLATS